MTLDYDIVLPLMLACVTAYTASRAISPDSLYSSFVKARGTSSPAALDALRVSDLMKGNPVSVFENARFPDIVAKFVGHRHHNLYVVGADQEFRGVIPLHEIKPYLNDPALAQFAIANDLLREEFPTVTPETTLRETLDKFATHPFERIPVVDTSAERKLIASISKTDLLLALGGNAPDARAITA